MIQVQKWNMTLLKELVHKKSISNMASVLDTDHTNFFFSICCWVNNICGLWANPQVHSLTASFLRMTPAPLISSPEVACYPSTDNSVFVFVYLNNCRGLNVPQASPWTLWVGSWWRDFPCFASHEGAEMQFK